MGKMMILARVLLPSAKESSLSWQELIAPMFSESYLRSAKCSLAQTKHSQINLTHFSIHSLMYPYHTYFCMCFYISPGWGPSAAELLVLINENRWDLDFLTQFILITKQLYLWKYFFVFHQQVDLKSYQTNTQQQRNLADFLGWGQTGWLARGSFT